MFSSFALQIEVFRELSRYASLSEDAVRDFIKYLHTSKGGAGLFASLAQMNKTMGGILNCLGQGFLSFDSNGTVSKITSRACVDLLEADPSEKKIWDVLKLTPERAENFRSWMKMAFEEQVDFDTLAGIGVPRYPHSQNRAIRLVYHALRSREGKITDIVMVATDQTEREIAEKEAEIERNNVQMINKLVRERKPFMAFVADFREQLVHFRRKASDRSFVHGDLIEFARFLHTMKGASGMFAITALASFIHELENEWAEFKKSNGDNPQVGKVTEVVTRQVQLLENKLEDFLTRNRDILSESIFMKERVVELPVSRIHLIKERFKKNGVSEQLLDGLSDLTREPIGPYLAPFARLSSSLADSQCKQIEPVVIRNGELSIFPEAYRDLLNSFVHIFRNAVDHGIELPEERVAKGKAPAGKIEVDIKGYEEAGRKWVRFLFKDDGRGIDPAKIREKLERTGAPSDWHRLPDTELVQKIFEPGFTTRNEVTDISGRGVGLDVVLAQVNRMGGRVRVTSKVGLGTEILVCIPEPSALPLSDVSFAA